ncbi:hypothetical protein [Rhodococcus koreensis]
MSVPGGPLAVVGSTLVAIVNANLVARCIGPELAPTAIRLPPT